ncbi:MAG: preprotein translocase subunit SecA [Pseudobdellovibrionaceae bacterium]
MLLKIATKIIGSTNDRELRRMRPLVEKINALEAETEALTDAELKAKTDAFRLRLAEGETEDDLLPEAFAVVREASKRVMGMRHFDVQLIGGITLHRGKIAEMRTGEGKTLMATLAVYLNALSGKGVHVVTVNDYLAVRDADWMGRLYNWLGLTVGCITSNMDDSLRKEAYASDITYGTNNEFGFDYLRDNMKYALADMAQRPFNFAIVDEVDSILIDEARTPLIISGPSESAADLYVKVDKVIPHLVDADYDVDEKMRTVTFTDEGTEHVENLLREHGILTEGNLYDALNISLVHHSNQALRAHKLFSRDTDYIVKDNKVIIIDEFTGRMMEGRRFSEGLHQALEAKEGVEIQNENQTLASITFQNYFRMYPKLAGMTGTAVTEATEFMEIYKLGVIDIPTNVPVARLDHDDQIYKSFAEKVEAIVNLVGECQERKQPVLIGTVSIEKSEILSNELKKRKIPHAVLNARYHEKEAEIIAQAGRPGAVTIATNMAGRGTDIQLGGNLEMRISQEIDETVDETKREKLLAKIKSEIEEDRATVREAGGLFVIGTERHESRRVDNQLRGRSGRQGDPGASIFFLSTQDDLMRIFSPEALEAVLSNRSIGLREGEALTHPWLTKALERAQARVEQQNFEVRKTLLKFDNVMNDQRRVIYEQRREIMDSPDISDLVTEMRHQTIEEIVANCIPPKAYPEEWDTDTLEGEVERVLNLKVPVKDWAKEEGIAEDELVERIIAASDQLMEIKASKGGDVFKQIQKSMTLQALDAAWKEHLLNLDHLRQGINLRAFGQKDPLNEYKTEAFAFFEGMLDGLRENIVHDLSHVEFTIDQEVLRQIVAAQAAEVMRQAETSRMDPALEGHANAAPSGEAALQTTVRKSFDESDPSTWEGSVGRNSPCPCGSGKKYKQCHGKLA